MLLRSGKIKESIPYFENAIKKQTWRNPNPYSGKCYYNLGVAYEYLEEHNKAYGAFFKATWSAETQSSAFYHLACIIDKKGDTEKALEFAESSLIRNYHNMKARTLKAELTHDKSFIKESYNIDKLCFGILYQQLSRDEFIKAMGDRLSNYRRLSFEYMKLGLYERAIEILELCPVESPLVEYYKGYAYGKTDKEKAIEHYKKTETLSSDYCFQNGIEEMLILENAIYTLGNAPMASYYLGCLLYDKKQYDKAIECWKRTVKQKSDFALAYHNLSIAHYNKKNDPQKALKCINNACVLEKDNSRFLLEQDQLSEKVGISTEKRLSFLEKHKELPEDRDTLCLAYITLLNLCERYGESFELPENHRFHVWEGGEGKLFNVPDNEEYYLMGKCVKAMGDTEKANYYFSLAAQGSTVPETVRYYNDQSSDYIYYIGLALDELGEKVRAKQAFESLIDFGNEHINDTVEYDFFAVSLPELTEYQDDIQKRNDDYCRGLIKLGKKGRETL